MGCPGICVKTEDSIHGIYSAFIDTGREESEDSRGSAVKHWRQKVYVIHGKSNGNWFDLSLCT